LSDTTWPQEEGAFDEQDLSAPDSDELPNPLEARLLHKLLIALNAPGGWPAWLIGGVALVPILAVAGLWWFVAGGIEALYLGLMLALFTLADAGVLVNLPRRRLSFGPVGPQLFALEFCRLVVAALAAPLAIWLGSLPILVGLVIINLGASLALAWGAVLEPQQLALSHLSLTSNPLPHDTAPLRLLHISDLHVERFGRREEGLLHMVREIAPDLILLTGDYLNLSYVDDPVAHAEARRVLAALVPDGKPLAPAGVYAVLGSPPVDRNSAPLFDGLPIRLLRDEVATVDLGQGRRLALLGLDCSHDLERDAERLAAVAAQAPPDAFRVLLYHSPELMPVAPEFDIKLYVCGHTHGGQVRLPLYGAVITSSKLGKRFEMGYYRLENTHLYVSRGVGLEGMGAPRVRFLCPPEITLFSLDGVGDKSLNTRAKEEAERESAGAKSAGSVAGLPG
jgi:predicted MPP superfamily phosphohydrolase